VKILQNVLGGGYFFDTL